MRTIESLDELRATVEIIEPTRCWRFLKEDGTPIGPKTVPTIGKHPPIQVARIAFSLSGGVLPKGWVLRRMRGCIKHCCNPAHLTAHPDHKGENDGRPSGNPQGNPKNFELSPYRKAGVKRPDVAARMRGNTLAAKY